MNERIKQLAEQATMIKGVNCEGYLGRSYTRQEEYFDKEKFAELIVKETMQVVANKLPSNQYLDVAHAVIEHYKDNDVT
jgi:hypothetical protein